MAGGHLEIKDVKGCKGNIKWNIDDWEICMNCMNFLELLLALSDCFGQKR